MDAVYLIPLIVLAAPVLAIFFVLRYRHMQT